MLTLAGLELLSVIFKSIGMKSSRITFSTSSKEILPQVSRRFNSKDYLVVSYNLDRASAGRVHQLSSDHGHQIQEKL